MIFAPTTNKRTQQKLKKVRAEVRAERKQMLDKYKTQYDNVKGMIPVAKREVYHRETPNVPSLNSDNCLGVAAAPEQKVYTGTKLVGIATMHKSNMVPVFSKDEATEVSRMRRG